MADVIPDLPGTKRPPRAAYALPTVFTAGNIFLGFLSIIRSIHGTLAFASNRGLCRPELSKWRPSPSAAAVVLDGLDGRIARMTNTTSDFGRELDSLADIVSFGIAPAVLAYTWGMQFVGGAEIAAGPLSIPLDQLQRAGIVRLVSFPRYAAPPAWRASTCKRIPSRNPGLATRKYFVGLPIPAAAALVAAVVYAAAAIRSPYFFPLSSGWLCSPSSVS